MHVRTCLEVEALLEESFIRFELGREDCAGSVGSSSFSSFLCSVEKVASSASTFMS